MPNKHLRAQGQGVPMSNIADADEKMCAPHRRFNLEHLSYPTSEDYVRLLRWLVADERYRGDYINE